MAKSFLVRGNHGANRPDIEALIMPVEFVAIICIIRNLNIRKALNDEQRPEPKVIYIYEDSTPKVINR